MSRKKLIKQLKKRNPNINLSDLETIIKTFSESFFDFLKQGKSINIRGFGRWYRKTLKENFNARNPATNELVYKPERVKVRFKASKKLNKIINQ